MNLDAIVSFKARYGNFIGGELWGRPWNAGWTPATFITNTCASSLILGAAGAAADGLYTSGNLKDVVAPSNAEDPAVAEYLAYMESQGLADIAATAAAGWTTAEVTVAIIKQAMESPEGLTRASIINAARNFEYTPMLAREGVVDTMNGADDPFLAESLQEAEKGAAETQRLHAAWRRGDAVELWNGMVADMRTQYPRLYQRINVDRNDAWVPKIRRILDQPGDDDALVVVGALHLLGDDGVVEKLRARGYQVERICSACKTGTR